MSAAVTLYDTVGAVEAAAIRAGRRIRWFNEDLRAVWSVMTAIPWLGTDDPEPEPWVNDGYVPPMFERILPDPFLDDWQDIDPPEFEEARDRLRAEVLERVHPSCEPTEPAPTVEYLNRLLGVEGPCVHGWNPASRCPHCKGGAA
jgi:hypothetical protein